MPVNLTSTERRRDKQIEHVTQPWKPSHNKQAADLLYLIDAKLTAWENADCADFHEEIKRDLVVDVLTELFDECVAVMGGNKRFAGLETQIAKEIARDRKMQAWRFPKNADS